MSKSIQEMDITEKEDFWMTHCDEMLRKGKSPKRWNELPEYLKTERMRKYYVDLKKRINK